MNFLELIGEKILDCVLAALGRNLDYLIHYKSNVDNLIPQVIYLLDAKDSIQNEVAAARRNLMEIHPHVQTWLTRSDGIIAEAEEFIRNNGQAKMTCCNGWCPNLKSRYQVSKRAIEIGLKVKEIKDEGKFDRVGYRKSPQAVGTATSNTGYEAFESRMQTLTGVLEALKDPKITRIGVYGMGGVGKTMLAKEVVKQAQKDQLFDKYLFLVVSKDPVLKNIQREMAERLGLKLEVESESVRGDQLRERLKQEKKTLIIIDDIWEALNLEYLGISFGDDQKGCKLLLTSRFYNVLCNDMDTQKQIPVEVLLKNEARNLFEKIVGDLAKRPEIQPNMLKIVEECSGLPIAIKTVANTLKNEKDIKVWEDAVNMFKMSEPIKIAGMDEKVYKSIKWSCEFLKSNEAKSLWLLCSLHREDYNIKVEDLIKYGVGLSLFGNLDKIEVARGRVHTLVKRLKDSSLLLEGDYNGTVKMHDVIRDVAINIAAEEKQMFMIRNTTDLQERLNCEDSRAISLPYIDDCDLPKRFECPNLHLFFMFDQKETLGIPISFFEGLKELRVLSLSQTWFEILPSSHLSLEKLRTLTLKGTVKDVTIIGELKNLKILSLSLKIFEQLPKEIGHLTHLQLLDLEECSDLKVIPPNVLSNMKILQELYLPRTVEWEVEEQSTERSNAMVSELDNLYHLIMLHVHIQNSKILPKAMVFERLVSYRIAIGSYFYGGEMLDASRILKLNISLQSDDGYKVLLRKCEALFLREMKGVKNILYELDSEGFQSLKHLTVQGNDEIQYIIKSMGVLGSVFPILESINLSNMINLKRICNTRLPAESFRNLRVVKVSKCCNLEFVFSSSMFGCFSHLQEMEIDDCKKMSEIIAIERKEEIEVNSDDNIMFAQLHSLTMSKLLKLKGFFSDDEYLVLFNRKVVFPNLEELEIEGMDSMKMIWPDQLILDSFCKLENLTVSKFTNLTNILPPNMPRTLQNLKRLKIDSCGSIEEVFEIQRTNNVEETHDIAATELRSLELVNLGKLKHVWSMDPQGIITFGKLNTVYIYGCSSLKSVFPTSVAKALMQLEMLKIDDCATVEQIIAKEEGIETTTLFVFPRLFSLNLGSLPELKSFYPGKHTSEWPLLNRLTIYECDKLKIFGSNKESVEETNGLDHDVSVIQQCFFSSEKDKFPNLEILSLDEGDAMNETCGGPSAEFYCNLKELWLYGNGEIPNVEAPIARAGVSDIRRLKNIVPFSSTSFHYLRELRVRRSNVLISLLTPSTARTLVQLQWIDIMDCKRMTEIVANEGSEAEAGDEIAFNNLTLLQLDNLPSLTAFHLGNRTIKFPSLDEVAVWNCPKLISLLTLSTARTLVQLRKIEIENCERMTEIVANQGSEAEAGDEITFNNLTSLRLKNLPSLTAFHLGNRIIKFPSLDEVMVENCPKLKIFCSGVLSTPKLTWVWMEGNLRVKKEGDGDGDLNTTIKEYWEAKLETCDQKFAEKIDASDGEESEHDANDDLERETTSEVGDTQCDGE
ncbi:probable disease resistance protein At4g27220 [Quercus lobata]|uniref:probable disease resistance protein At4g27220 n=1 Tax=Quercus lobata TaxID=97700 RepID=UPI001243C137|nr:probable disease resistance protein At4g27220 [Quercus lobata]